MLSTMRQHLHGQRGINKGEDLFRKLLRKVPQRRGLLVPKASIQNP